MKKRKCTQMETNWIPINGIWYVQYKCKYSKIASSRTIKELCNECIKQLKLNFE